MLVRCPIKKLKKCLSEIMDSENIGPLMNLAHKTRVFMSRENKFSAVKSRAVDTSKHMGNENKEQSNARCPL